MKFAEIKDVGEIKLAGITPEIDLVDKVVRAITLRDAEGHVLRIERGESYQRNIEILVPAPPVMVERWRLAGTIPALRLRVLEYHDDRHDADRRLTDLDEMLRTEHELKVERVSVSEEDAAAHPSRDGADLDQIPF